MDTTDHAFKSDLAEIAAEKYKAGTLSRRGFLSALGALGLVPFLGDRAVAAPTELVVCNWGGQASDILRDLLGKAYEEETGVPVRVDGAGPSPGKVRAMVESGAVVWDLCDSGAGSAIVMNGAGVIQDIDYSIVDRAKVLPGTDLPFGVGNYVFSYALAYNPTMLPDGVPETWADVWNVKDFPGMRTFRKSVRGQLEGAALAMGVAKDEVYQFLDDEGIKAAIAKFRELRDNIIVWGSGSESQNLFLQGEVAMGNIYSTRGYLLKDQMEPGSFRMTYAGGVLQPGIWVVPKNNPAGPEAAMRFIATAQDPDLQVEWFKAIGNGPINPAAAARVPAELAAWNPTSAENVAKQVIYSDEWYGRNQVSAEELYIDALIG
ncbi:ABC transporter substrate-binding protein [Pseudodonghicola flavimaris]|uniref:ABC transporter substrate-binding protein n=1 Tax=Pseudodonghicola flavimaris TaxID=3050036 RepID=A0ABT7F2P0_9RHOB|nr:ABC transporter substrate-binding protein [Pseudodonghicola flavimaris]MDK3018876.1 ABC transporter substrate-binding protein [Pseudodonghicola flavimaris]